MAGPRRRDIGLSSSDFDDLIFMAITLIGYRGTGKTTVGAALAERLNWEFVDLDPGIERRTGMSIAEIFKRHGEPYFRVLEADALKQILAQENTVISPGGGVILDPENRAAIKAAGPVVWLFASVDTIAERLSADPATANNRPSLTGTNVLSEIGDVLQARSPIYEEVATISVSTENRTPASIVDEIVSRLS